MLFALAQFYVQLVAHGNRASSLVFMKCYRRTGVSIASMERMPTATHTVLADFNAPEIADLFAILHSALIFEHFRDFISCGRLLESRSRVICLFESLVRLNKYAS